MAFHQTPFDHIAVWSPPLRFIPFLQGTCHIWAAGGVGEQKLDAGWVPGTTPYPVPPVADFLE